MQGSSEKEEVKKPEFKVGDRVKAVRFGEWTDGLDGVVSSIEDGLLLVTFEGAKGRGHKGRGRFGPATFGDMWFMCPSELELIPPAASPPSIAADLRLTPQAKTVLSHIKRNNSISPTEALIVHGISRLASCIHEIRKRAGYLVDCEIRKDDQGHKYASYSFAKSQAVH